MSSDVSWHIRDKLRPVALRPRKPEGSLGRTAQDGHLDSHTAPELWFRGCTHGEFTYLLACYVRVTALFHCWFCMWAVLEPHWPVAMVSRCRVHVFPDPGKLIRAVLFNLKGDKRPAPGGRQKWNDSRKLKAMKAVYVPAGISPSTSLPVYP